MAVFLGSCDARQPDGETQKAAPVSRFQYRLEVDPDSLPPAVAARRRVVPGTDQVQIWLSNASDTEYVIESADRQGKIVRRQKIVGGAVYLETSTGEWQRLEGVAEVLLHLNFTPKAIVGGREPASGAGAGVPPSEPFSIAATFGDERRPIRGQIVYSVATSGSR